MSDLHRTYMGRALTLARRGLGRTSPNPAVGCVIVRDGMIVGEGWHRQAGTPHAEVHALRMAGDLARGADLFVTLEPCSHHGRTPPCADALIAAGVGRVFVGTKDPNPKVSGRGIGRLAGAGIPVVTGLREDDCRRLIEPFAKLVTTGRPFVILKSAMTLDGRTATATGDARWISGERSRRLVHRLRDQVDAVMVGSGTLLADDPQLTVRTAAGRDPLRVVVDSRLRIPLDARILHLDSAARTLVATTGATGERVAALQDLGAEVLVCREREGRVDLVDLLERLGRLGVQSVLLEGGETLAGEALRAGLIDKFLFFYGPKLVGGTGRGLFAGPGVPTMAEALPLRIHRVSRSGADILVEAYPEEQCSPA
jgi:diaminohydroxyphosphoribosylaminopyrimidine deaminase / 5-amino-6-(5-phosphoribosylamino)uracil reductase